MDTEQQLQHRRKRKRGVVKHFHISSRSLFLCFSFFIFLLFLSNYHGFFTHKPPLSSSTLSLLYSSASLSILDDPLQSTAAKVSSTTLSLSLQHQILFPNHYLIILNNEKLQTHEVECVYYTLNGSSSGSAKPVLSMDYYDESRSVARCPFPETNDSTSGGFKVVDLRRFGEVGRRNLSVLRKQPPQSWDRVAYEAMLDGDTVVVFVKGLNLRPHKISDPTNFRCHFGLRSFHKDGVGASFLLSTKAVSVAQEIVRCVLPLSIRNKPEKARGVRVTVSNLSGNLRRQVRTLLPSVARVGSGRSVEKRSSEKYELCVCTMVWNQASALREWIMYHSWLGVERWFIYDNNSDDGIENVVNDLDSKGFNVSRKVWPWIKTQEAGFSHCALRAREDCKWVGFFDVDEFFYFPNEVRRHNEPGESSSTSSSTSTSVPGEKSLRSVVANFSSSTTIAEIRTACHSFGPSGLTSHPKQGVTIGYTCRLASPERHKSIVRPDLLDASLLNVVHHFQLKEGFESYNMPEHSVIVNHYKYQVWESFKAKFFRRVATYVVDWQQDQNKGSKDRAPGLGTEAIEPDNWRLRFCEVKDTGLKDYVLSHFADPATGSMPWEKH
ncbi:unnamed protein product [Vicia faba]|uniref:Glycosyltransferase family 92 protein n=1 Tax=Vicia faba TaxID=3906 RepID=A0AAV0YTW8_VICFA|nr:unnamed protein product [Vicia faba]